MANIQIGTNLRNCKITLAAEFYQPWGVLFSFQNNTTDVINSSSFTDTSMPGGMTVYDVNGSGIFSSVSVNGFTSYGTLDATTFDIPNDKDYIVSTLDDGFTTATYEPLTSNIQIPITKNGKTTLATKGTKNVEDIDINVDISPTIQSLSITPSETSQTFNASNVDGYKPVNVSAIQTETPTVNLSLASGNQTVNASSGKYIKSLTITKPSTLVASNIKSGVNIAGVNGTYEFKTQNKTFTPTQTGGSVSADSGYDGLGVVTVNPVPLGNKTDVPLNFYNQTAGTIADSQNIYSDENKFMTWASVARPATLIAENIKKDINIAGITGTLESGGADEETVYTEINAMTFGSTKYSVYLPDSYFDSNYTPQYSIDNGVTWNNFPSSNMLKIRTAQIKFKVTGYFTGDGSGMGGYWSQTELTSTKLGMNITAGGSGYPDEVISDNYILTQDIDDITCSSNMCCFVEGTQVLMADGTHKNIENIEVGEQVLTYNEENSSFEIDNVTRMVINPNTVDLATIILSDNSKITFNAYHPFLTTEGFKSLTQHEGLPKLKVGDMLVSNEDNLTIINIEREQLSTPIKTYNLTISHNHNFLVGEKDSFVVAHNIACPI